MAQSIDLHGWRALRAVEFDQHPGYPAAILAARNALLASGAADSPMTWQRAGQTIAAIGGLASLALLALATRRIARALGAPLDGRLAALVAVSLAGVLALNVWLSVDVMSESLYLTCFLAAICAILTLPSLWAAFLAGGLAGLAYLIRPEAIVLCAGVAAAVIATAIRSRGSNAPGRDLRRATISGLISAAAFLLTIAPYCVWVGGLSPKANKQTIDQFRAAINPPPVAQAALVRTDYSWYGAIAEAAYETLRGGRFVIPIVGIVALLRMRRDWSRPAMAGLTACVACHFLLTCLLPYRHGYIDTRHTLVVIMLLAIPAGLALAFVYQQYATRGKRTAGRVLVGLCIVVPALWSLRIPNRDDAFIPRAAAALAAVDPQLAEKRLLSGSSPRRVAFYAGMEHVPWPENEPTLDARFEALRARLGDWPNPPEYFAIETGSDDERKGNDVLLSRLLADASIAGRLREIVREPGANDVVIRIFVRDR